MTINKYELKGENFWRVTVHVRSTKDRKRRIQKKVSKITNEKEAKTALATLHETRVAKNRIRVKVAQ